MSTYFFSIKKGARYNGKKDIPDLTKPAYEKRVSTVKVNKPRVLIPVFPGTNCEYDSAKAVARAGGEPEIIVINNLSASGIDNSIK